MFFNSLMEMTSSVADIICIAQITFKLKKNCFSRVFVYVALRLSYWSQFSFDCISFFTIVSSWC